MKLIMRSEFDALRLNPDHSYDADRNGDKQIVRIYCDDKLIAKKVTQKKHVRYFGVADYKQYLSATE
ncbi:hypothetical protein [Thalassotalea agarivorans]|uniref:Uncharacterized protein n=1 Tax=Thalassotalea agarivorans TaxID=349064 RepID=A0A1H9YMJ5_THASX|nr:hypothetical protein [Thalassotalea agarivorans]SES69832.1 hypothetical protein SAMN05660429_00266 [Thalassotalea agarivorans]